MYKPGDLLIDNTKGKKQVYVLATAGELVAISTVEDPYQLRGWYHKDRVQSLGWEKSQLPPKSSKKNLG